ncbi:phosphotransferase [Serinicoccus kebangsaanensis]|uniref:phosphotransferase n=1 Tax=Serinicoccus kebangsaanensis TaxID=2602069 RepID=UPI00124D47DF|nr:phosphotransferase [Serinicoccus kebangsaanensis]
MHEEPRGVTTEQVLDRVRDLWDPSVDALTHLPIGFGAWHWRADVTGEPRYFVTLDPPLWHTAQTLEATYAAAARLAASLPAVHAGLATTEGRFTSPLAEGWLSCTPWVHGSRPDALGPDAVSAVRALHATPPPEGVVTWVPLVRPDLVEELDAWSTSPWDSGPHGEAARTAIRRQAADVARGLSAYLRLTHRLDPSSYVPTHGEPGLHNLWRADDGRLLLLDWETLRLAPRERDVLDGYASLVPHDPDLLRLFRLEWQLGEVRSYADWLRGPHDDDGDTRTALGGLRHELGGLGETA